MTAIPVTISWAFVKRWRSTANASSSSGPRAAASRTRAARAACSSGVFLRGQPRSEPGSAVRLLRPGRGVHELVDHVDRLLQRADPIDGLGRELDVELLLQAQEGLHHVQGVGFGALDDVQVWTQGGLVEPQGCEEDWLGAGFD